MKICSYHYENIFLVSGNHEYFNPYGIEKTDEEIQKSLPSNIHYIKNQILEMENAFVLGCVLWSHITSVIGGKADDRIISQGKELSIEGWNELHNADVSFLEKTMNSLNKTDKKVIVMTHFPPSYQMCAAKYFHRKDVLDRYYTNLEYLISKPINTWICGHSHSILSKNINNVNVIMNAGFQYDENLFNKCKIGDKC